MGKPDTLHCGADVYNTLRAGRPRAPKHRRPCMWLSHTSLQKSPSCPLSTALSTKSKQTPKCLSSNKQGLMAEACPHSLTAMTKAERKHLVAHGGKRQGRRGIRGVSLYGSLPRSREARTDPCLLPELTRSVLDGHSCQLIFK